MKIIHVAGFSNSGKTTFIMQLIPVLTKHGKVGVIKHLGHHRYDDGEGMEQKDTSKFFAADADLVAGIDKEKTVITVPSTSLADTASIYSALGMDYIIIEGFRTLRCKKIWLGTQEDAEDLGIASYCILWNPVIEDVMRYLDAFDSFDRNFFDP